MVKIRLARGGAKKKPYYRIVVADARAKRDGRYIERIGSYDPMIKENRVTIDMERVRYWLSAGAQPTDRVQKFIKAFAEAPTEKTETPESTEAESAPSEKEETSESAAAEGEVSAS